MRRGRRSESPPAVDQARFAGGRYRPLEDAACERIVETALRILREVGVGSAPPWLARVLIGAGASRRDDGRILFPSGHVDAALARAARRVELPGSDARAGLCIGGGPVHLGTGGAAVRIPDPHTGAFRPTRLGDLYRMMCVLEACEHVDYGVRPVVACDMPSALDLDLNTAYACVRATGKPIGVSFQAPEHVDAVTHLFGLALGRSFRRQPFCMAVIVHVVPPLRFAEDGVSVMRAAIAAGMPLQICSAGQAGATAPASLAGALAQGLAECLAGLMVVDALRPGHPCIFALMPFVSDLRTGAMSGGSGEAAVASAAAAQLLRHLELPCTVSAGTTDAKVADVQAGYEKGCGIALAAQAGAHMVNLSVGMLGSIVAASPEALVLDDDLCGAILRTVRGVDVREEHLQTRVFERAVTGDGHYLGDPETLALMRTEYVYPRLADRRSIDEWVDAGRPDIEERARERARALYTEHAAGRLSRRAERAIHAAFTTRLGDLAT